MRISELRPREAFDQILQDTLQTGWSLQFEEPVTLGPAAGPGRQLWRCQPLLNALFTEHIGSEARRFLVDSFRVSPIRHRLLPQYALGTLLGAHPVLLRASSPAFRVSPAISGTAHRIVMPGNQRVRVFDFESGLCRVFLKTGFATSTMRTEIQTRAADAVGRFPWCPPILDAAADHTWFEESILDARPLPRCPPTVSRSTKCREASSQLDSWLDLSRREVVAASWAQDLVRRVESRRGALEQRWGESPFENLWASLGVLAREAERLGGIGVAVGHGDLQPGNILIERSSRRTSIIDWERSAERFDIYDRLVLALESRYARSRRERIRAFALGKDFVGTESLPRDREWRRGVAALFVLEELWWYVEECFLGPYFTPAAGLVDYLDFLAERDANPWRMTC